MMAAIHASSRRRAQEANKTPVAVFNWAEGAALGAETVTRSGTATRINSSGIMVTAPTNTLRLDYTATDPNVLRGVLIEPAATQLMPHSNNPLGGFPWDITGSVSIAPGGGTGMDGTNSLKTITCTGTGSDIKYVQTTIPNNATVTLRAYMKAGTGSWVSIAINDTGFTSGKRAWFNLATPERGNFQAGLGAIGELASSIKKLANGICELTMTAKTTGVSGLYILMQFASSNERSDGVITSVNGSTYLFDSVSLEVNQSATSYIPATSGSTVARGAETVTVPVLNGTYDVMVRDNEYGEWRNGITVSNGAYSLTPRTGKRHVLETRLYAAGALTTAEKNVLISIDPATVPQPDLSLFDLTFEDTFSTRSISTSGSGTTWKSQFPWGGRIQSGSGELGYYSDSSTGYDPFEIRNGNLIIKVNPGTNETNGTNPYNCGIITNQHSFSQTRGYFEIRCKIPVGKGLWPAFWLIASDLGWPPEIDVFETFGALNNNGEGGPRQSHVQLHTSVAGFGRGQWMNTPSDITTDFHTYGCLWDPDFIYVYFDGKELIRYPTPPDYNEPMYLVANIACGGWPGSPDGTNVWPAEFEIDYIRAYARKT